MPERAKGKPAGGGPLPARRETVRSRIARLRRRAGGAPTAPGSRAARVSRREREAHQQRLLRVGGAVVGVLVAVVLLAGALNEWVLKPRAVLAEVAGESIRRADYWTAHAIDLVEQALLYRQFAAFDPGGDYAAQADAALAQIPAVRGSTDTDPGTLDRMIDDRLYLRGAEAMGLPVTDAEAEAWTLDRFAPEGASLRDAAPTPTLTPAREAMRTATAAAEAIAALPVDATPGALPPPPSLGIAVVGTPTADLAPLATPDLAEARATAEADFDEFVAITLGDAGLTLDDYLRFAARPAVAREKVEDAIAAEVGQSGPQVHAAHILVATKDLADQLAADLAGGADFSDLARANSIDEATAGNGGDLGWFVREEMVTPFADVAFGLPVGETSAPVETEFGWHLVRVLETDADRPFSDAQIDRIRQVRSNDWLAAERAAANVTTSLPPVPTPAAPDAFVPPIDAPPPPPPTVVPLLPATPEATPAS